MVGVLFLALVIIAHYDLLRSIDTNKGAYTYRTLQFLRGIEMSMLIPLYSISPLSLSLIGAQTTEIYHRTDETETQKSKHTHKHKKTLRLKLDLILFPNVGLSQVKNT